MKIFLFNKMSNLLDAIKNSKLMKTISEAKSQTGEKPTIS
jgi:dihydrodipicolinate synthase/N-acetylneuraminate lyase